MQSQNPPKFELYVFDWDGTVMDTTTLIARGIQEAAKSLGCKEPDLKDCKAAIGLGWDEILRRVVPDCPESQWNDFAQAYRDWYIRREEEVPVVEGLRELMTAMKEKGLRLAVATGKSRQGLNRVFGLTGLAPLFEDTVTADETFSKPNPAMLHELSDRTGVPCENMVMIGDSVHDLMLAQNAGAAAVGVSYGGCSKEELDKYPNIGIAADTEELAKILGLEDLLVR
ncbi:MAG: HAD-IA family hydrolase [Sutterellaceae bacterium]|nr:HAD-IA family hydrolase [Sutterellaceae bacterium]